MVFLSNRGFKMDSAGYVDISAEIEVDYKSSLKIITVFSICGLIEADAQRYCLFSAMKIFLYIGKIAHQRHSYTFCSDYFIKIN